MNYASVSAIGSHQNPNTETATGSLYKHYTKMFCAKKLLLHSLPVAWALSTFVFCMYLLIVCWKKIPSHCHYAPTSVQFALPLTVVNKILQAHQENGLYCFCWSLRSEAVSQETRQILKHQVVRCPWIKSRAKMTGGEVLLVQSTSSRISMWSRSKGNSKTDWCLCAVFSSSSENFSFEKQAQTVLRHFWLVGHLVIAFIRAPR